MFSESTGRRVRTKFVVRTGNRPADTIRTLLNDGGWSEGWKGHNMKVRELLRLLASDGWAVDRTRGSHRQLRHPTKPGTVTVSGHPRDDVHPKTLRSVLRQAGLEDRT